MLEARSKADLALQVSAQLKDLINNARKHVSAGMNTQLLRKLADEYAAGMARFANQPRAEAHTCAHQAGSGIPEARLR